MLLDPIPIAVAFFVLNPTPAPFLLPGILFRPSDLLDKGPGLSDYILCDGHMAFVLVTHKAMASPGLLQRLDHIQGLLNRH